MKKNSHQLPVLLYILRTVFSRRMTRLVLGVGSIVGALVFFSQFFPWFSVEYTTRNDPFMWFFLYCVVDRGVVTAFVDQTKSFDVWQYVDRSLYCGNLCV